MKKKQFSLEVIDNDDKLTSTRTANLAMSPEKAKSVMRQALVSLNKTMHMLKLTLVDVLTDDEKLELAKLLMEDEAKKKDEHEQNL